MKSATALFIDAGGVLANPNWDRIAAVLGRHGVASAADALARAEPRAKLALDLPERVRSTDDRSRAGLYWQLVLEGAGVRASADALARAWAELDEYHRRENLWETVLPGVPEALEILGTLGLRLIVVSNSNGTLREKLRRLDLLDRFDLILDSHEVGFEKPDPRIFELAMDQAGVAREHAFHVGDLYEIDVIGARAAGLRAVLVDPLDLYLDRDCPRVISLRHLAEMLESGQSPFREA